ncbi:MAG TPA: response regulator transcription factor [Candidatus Saccharimonadales bacterium]|nr:response regulator transcription factor [Candidatus Saccharimonadales bacterium]
MKKILIVDDDIAILDAMQIILEEEGYMVKTSIDGKQIGTDIRDFEPNLILLDIWMSGKSGLEIAEELRKDAATRLVPIIMMSALTDGKKAVRNIGVNDYLMKPFTIKEITEKVKKHLQK